MSVTPNATLKALWAADYATVPLLWKKLRDKAGEANATQLTRWLAQNDRWFLLTVILGRKDLLHPWLYARCREVEQATDSHLDLWARGHGKSSIITFGGIIQEVLNNPNITICIFSHTRPIAKGFLRVIKREFEMNERLMGLFPDIFYKYPKTQAPVWSEDSGLIVQRSSNPKEATVEAYGLVDGQPISRHYGLLVYDDVVTAASVTTPEMLQKTTEGWELSLNLGGRKLRAWYIGTRYSYADTYREIMERGAATPRLYPGTNDGTFQGEPVLLTRKEMADKLQQQGRSTFAAQILQNPIAGVDSTFNVEWLKYWEVRPVHLNVYIVVDPANSKKKTSDRTAMLVVGVDQNRNKFLLDGYLHRMDLRERWTALRNLHRKWNRVEGVQTLKVGYEKFGMQVDVDHMKERMEQENYRFNIEEMSWARDTQKQGKVDRIVRLQPEFESGRIYFPLEGEPTKRMERFPPELRAAPIRRRDENGRIYSLGRRIEEEMLLFPAGGRDDGLDALSRVGADIGAVPAKPPGLMGATPWATQATPDY